MKLSKEGPTLLCVVCNRCRYFRTVVQFESKNYDIAMADLVHTVSDHQKSYICWAFHSSIKKSQISAQVVSNMLKVFP